MARQAPEDVPGRLYLVTPERLDPEAFAAALAPLLTTGHVACLRLDLGAAPEEDWVRAANHLMPVCHEADVPLMVAEHFRLVERLGLDGVHLGAKASVRKVRAALGSERLIGATGGTSRHTAMTLAEAGADYVSLGPLHSEGALGSGETAPDDLFQWWAEMIETPVVAEGGVTPADAARLAAAADFFVPARTLWQADDPVAVLASFAAALEEEPD